MNFELMHFKLELLHTLRAVFTAILVYAVCLKKLPVQNRVLLKEFTREPLPMSIYSVRYIVYESLHNFLYHKNKCVVGAVYRGRCCCACGC